MKKNVLKRLLVFVLTLAMLAPITGYLGTNVDEVQAAEKEDAIGYVIVPANEVITDEIDGNKVYTSANYEDYLFAGWYTDAAATKAAASGATGAYARFVPEDVLSTKVQVTNGIVQKTDVERYKGNYVMRFVSSVDSTDYKHAGFELSYLDEETGEKVFVKESTTYKAFERIESTTGSTKNGDVETYNFGPKVVDTKSEYLITGKWAVAPSDVDRDYLVRAYWMTKDGTKVYGKERCVSVNDGAGATGQTTINFTVDANLSGSGYTATYKNASNVDVSISAENVKVIPTGTQTTVRLKNADKNLKSVTSISVYSGTTEVATGSYRNLYTKYAGPGTEDTTWYNESDTEFVIATSADLYGFASVVNSGKNFAPKKTVYLVADITVNQGDAYAWKTYAPSYSWTPIGFNGDTDKTANLQEFAGVFDGCMHTISGIYLNTDIRYSGFFAGTASTAKIRNFKLKNSYFNSTHSKTAYSYFGSIVGSAQGEFDTIYSNAIVETTAGVVGGLVGGFRLSAGKINNCWFSGTLTNTGTGRQIHGGVVGFVYSSLEMKNCLNTGTIISKVSTASPWTGGLIGGCETTQSTDVSECLNVGLIQTTHPHTANYGPIVGTHLNGKKAPTITKESTYATAESSSFNRYKDQTTTVNEADIMGEAAKTQMGNLDWDNTWATVENSTPVLKAFENERYARVDVSWYYTHEDDPTYTLYDAADLYGLAAVANMGEEFKDKTIYLDNDIVVNEGNANDWDKSAPALSWTPIGIINYFRGTFDGQGNTISGLYMDTTARYAGLFATTGTQGIVQNLNLTNSYFKSTYRDIGGIAGGGYGNFYNIYCNAIVEGSAQAMGGLIGLVGNTNQVIENCWFAGSVIKTSNNKDQRDTGGFIGHLVEGTMTIRNCLNTGTVDVRMYDTQDSDDNTIVYPKAGGFIGTVANQAKAIIQKCVNVGEIKVNEQLSEDEIKGYGPFIGWNNLGSTNITITDSYASDSCPVEINNLLAHNNITATYTRLAENDMKGSLAQDNMDQLDWTGAWKSVEGAFPEIRFTYATAAEQALLASLYEGRALYQGDMHAHAYTYGRGQEGSIFDFNSTPRRRWNS